MEGNVRPDSPPAEHLAKSLPSPSPPYLQVDPAHFLVHMELRRPMDQLTQRTASPVSDWTPAQHFLLLASSIHSEEFLFFPTGTRQLV